MEEAVWLGEVLGIAPIQRQRNPITVERRVGLGVREESITARVNILKEPYRCA